MSDTARIYVAFTSEGLGGSAQTFSLHHPNERVLNNEEMLDELRQRCEGIEFVGTTKVAEPTYVLGDIKGQKPGLDGVLYFGAPPEDLLALGLPVVAVHPLWGQWQEPFHAYGGKVLTATLPVIADASEARFASRLDAVARKLMQIRTAARMQGLRILCVTDKPVLGEYEPGPRQVAAEGWDGYERTYLSHLGELGAEMVVRPQEEMVARQKAASEAEAAEIAQKWIAEAEGMRGTNESEVRESAKLYLAMKEMMAEYRCDAVTTEGYGFFMYYPGGTIPSQGLPSSQFCTDGVVATSETLIDSLVTQQFGLWLTGSTGFNGDYIVDVENNKVYIGHCECPLNPYGDERRAPYVVRNLPQWPVDQQEIGGACVQVNLPDDEIVTVAKMGVHDRKLALFTGRTVSGNDLFPGWEDILCRTKLAIDVDASKLFERLDWQTFGWHRVAFYGDHREAFRGLATVLGYETIEEDR